MGHQAQFAADHAVLPKMRLTVDAYSCAWMSYAPGAAVRQVAERKRGVYVAAVAAHPVRQALTLPCQCRSLNRRTMPCTDDANDFKRHHVKEQQRPSAVPASTDSKPCAGFNALMQREQQSARSPQAGTAAGEMAPPDLPGALLS